MEKSIKKIPFQRFQIIYFGMITFLFFVSFFQQGTFMNSFSTAVIAGAYSMYFISFLISAAAYGILFHFVLKGRKWAYYLLLFSWALALADVVYDLGFLLVTMYSSPAVFNAVAQQINVSAVILEKLLAIILFSFSAVYIYFFCKSR